MELGFSKELHRLIELYVQNVRALLPAIEEEPDDDKPLFVSFHGKGLTAGDLANAITLELCRMGYKHRANCTKFRKMAVTMVG